MGGAAWVGCLMYCALSYISTLVCIYPPNVVSRLLSMCYGTGIALAVSADSTSVSV